MINQVIFVCMAVLSTALLSTAIKMRNTIKNENPDKMRASMFLRYDVFKRTNLFIIDGSIIVFFIQVMNIAIGISDFNVIFEQVMPVINVISLLVIGYIFVHLIQTVRVPDYNSRRSELEHYIYGDDNK
ncbi:MAG: hypothetical protein JXA98_04910 [Methanosarcinaceae archaeon]|nr:hypothetical protein [Methanosarcinaceae archaeon]